MRIKEIKSDTHCSINPLFVTHAHLCFYTTSIFILRAQMVEELFDAESEILMDFK